MAPQKVDGESDRISCVSYRVAASALVRLYMDMGKPNAEHDKEVATLAEMCVAGDPEVAAQALGRLGYIVDPMKGNDHRGGGAEILYESLKSDDPELVWAAIAMLKALLRLKSGQSPGEMECVEAMNNLVVKKLKNDRTGGESEFSGDETLQRWHAFKTKHIFDRKTFEQGGMLGVRRTANEARIPANGESGVPEDKASVAENGR